MLAVTKVGNHIYVSTSRLGGVLVFDIRENGTLFNMRKIKFTIFGDEIVGLAAEGEETLLAVDDRSLRNEESKLYKIDVSEPEKCIKNEKSCHQSTINITNNAMGVISDDVGNFWFQNKGKRDFISIYNKEGKYLGKPHGDGIHSGGYLTGITRRNNNIYYIEGSSGKVKMFQIAGRDYGSNKIDNLKVTLKLTTAEKGEEFGLRGVAVDTNGYIFAGCKEGIAVYKPEGSYLHTINWPGSKSFFITGLYVDDESGLLYAIEMMSHTLIVIKYT